MLSKATIASASAIGEGVQAGHLTTATLEVVD